jgi:SAM-dependent methyltransferase
MRRSTSARQALRSAVARISALEPARVLSAVASDYARELGPGLLSSERHPVTRLLYERLDEEDVEEVQRRAAAVPELPPIDRNDASSWALVLTYGIWFDVPSVAEKTGLLTLQPPEEIHAMARGPLAAAGGLYEADMVTDALASVGVSIDDVGSGLDFGCSSGRVLRVLSCAYPQVRWLGCDPNEPATAWARANLPGAEFFTSAQIPPLGLDYGSLDLVYAISIWSHFQPELGLRWFDEMHRLLKPGGYLVCTTHGLQSIALYAAAGARSLPQSEEIMRALYRQGSWYAPEFGARGDWGVVNSAWGTAFLSPEWLLTKLCPLWRVLEFAPGRNQQNQDVYVLERV